MKRGLFVTGTDTGIGKTLCSALLVSASRQASGRAGYFKPVQTGSESDCATVAALCGIGGADLPPPVYAFSMPASPHRAAAAESSAISIDRISGAWRELPHNHWIVEGAGGLLVPLNERETLRDLARALGLPLLVVTSTRLGTINHTLLTLEAARSAGLAIAGLVLSGPEDPGLAQTLAHFAKVPVLAEIPPLHDLSPQKVTKLAPGLFPPSMLDRLFAHGSEARP